MTSASDPRIERQIVLRLPTEDEEARAHSKFMVRGYLASKNRVVPLDDWDVGIALFVNSCTQDEARSIYRMARREGYAIEKIVDGTHSLFLRTGDLAPQKIRIARTKYTRFYDHVMANPQVQLMRRRREDPDGIQRAVRVLRRGDVEVNAYPWDQMQDGDFFIVELRRGNSREKRQMLAGFRDASCRKDFEIQVVDWQVSRDGEMWPALRVTKIQPGLADLKRRHYEMLMTEDRRPLLSPYEIKKKIGTGRKRSRPKQTHRTIDRAAVKALEASGFDREEAKRIIEAKTGRTVVMKEDEREIDRAVRTEHEAARSALQSRGPRPGRDKKVSGVPARHEEPELIGRDAARDVEADAPPKPDTARRLEATPNVALEGPEHVATEALSERGPGGGGAENLDAADAPTYDRAEIIRRRLAALGEEA